MFEKVEHLINQLCQLIPHLENPHLKNSTQKKPYIKNTLTQCIGLETSALALYFESLG